MDTSLKATLKASTSSKGLEVGFFATVAPDFTWAQALHNYIEAYVEQRLGFDLSSAETIVEIDDTIVGSQGSDTLGSDNPDYVLPLKLAA